MRILVVDDEARLARHVSSALTEAGHDPVVIHDGEAALREAEKTPFDLIVLDVGLPGMDGFEVLRRMRAKNLSHRVLMLTARGEVTDRVTGLQLGADDYLAKPFAMQELVARVRALGRRYAEEPEITLRVVAPWVPPMVFQVDPPSISTPQNLLPTAASPFAFVPM